MQILGQPVWCVPCNHGYINININPRWIRFDLHKVRCPSIVHRPSMLPNWVQSNFYYRLPSASRIKSPSSSNKSILGNSVDFGNMQNTRNGLPGPVCVPTYSFAGSAERWYRRLTHFCSSNMTGYIRWIFKWHQSNWNRIARRRSHTHYTHTQSKRAQAWRNVFDFDLMMSDDAKKIYGNANGRNFDPLMTCALPPSLSLSVFLPVASSLDHRRPQYINSVVLSAHARTPGHIRCVCATANGTSDRKLSCKLNLIGSKPTASASALALAQEVCIAHRRRAHCIMAFDVNNFKRLSTTVSSK